MPVNDKKRAYGARLGDYINEYKQAFLVGCDNVGSRQMQQIRVALRGSAVVVMGKNTTIRKVIKDFLKKNPGHPIEILLPEMVGNVGLVFTNGDLAKTRDVIVSNKVPAPARVGSAAPVEVWIEPGATGCDPGQTSWFQALNIPTKINKGQIEMISRVKLLSIGDKVGDSAAALLQKLKIQPFSYGMKIVNVYDNGSIYPEAILDMDAKVLMAKLTSSVSLFASLCLGLGFPTKASFVHSINYAYKTILAISMGTDYKIKQVEAFENFKGEAAPSGGAAAAGGAAPAAAAKVEEKKEEEEEDAGGAGGLFGGDDDW